MVIAAEFRNGQFFRDGPGVGRAKGHSGRLAALAFAASATVTIFWSLHAGDGDDDAGCLDDVYGVDADGRTDLAGRHRVICRHVARDDVGDDAPVLGSLCCGATGTLWTGEVRHASGG